MMYMIPELDFISSGQFEREHGREATTYAARMIWENQIRHLREFIEHTDKVMSEVSGDAEDFPLIQAMIDDHLALQDAFHRFEVAFPEPITHVMNDNIKFDPNWMDYWDMAEIKPSLPLVPLTLINSMEHQTLLYTDTRDCKVYKVPNIWYNQPSNRARIEYAW